MLPKVLIAIAGLAGLGCLSFTRDYYARFIIVLMAAAIVLSLCPDTVVQTIGFVLYSVAVVLVMVYALLKRNFTPRKRVLIMLVALPVFVEKIFALNHWPNMMVVKELTAISLIIFIIIALTNFKNYKNEFGFLFIMAIDALINARMAMISLGYME